MSVTVIRPAASAWLHLGEHFARLREYGDLLYTLSAHRIGVRYKQTSLGFAWAVLQPVMMMIIFTAVFSRLARMPSDGAPYALFAYTALLPWAFFNTAVSGGTNSLVAHTQLITKVYFPREILPITYVIAALFDFMIGGVVLLTLMYWYSVPLSIHAFLLIPIVFVLALWILAVSLVLAAIQVRIRDVGVALPVFLQLLMFASPIIYPLSAVPPSWRFWYLLNPLAGLVSSFRDVLLRQSVPDPSPLGMACLVTALALPAAYMFFKHAEATMADQI
jgi:lipopolysaccharide transport system permease protein